LEGKKAEKERGSDIQRLCPSAGEIDPVLIGALLEVPLDETGPDQEDVPPPEFDSFQLGAIDQVSERYVLRRTRLDRWKVLELVVSRHVEEDTATQDPVFGPVYPVGKRGRRRCGLSVGAEMNA
jgi:hypothetical protein